MSKTERRLQVYKEVVRFISVGIRDATYDDNELMTFRSKVCEADFLFGEEVPKYIDELHGRAVNLYTWTKEYRDYSQPKPEGYDHAKVVEGMHHELKWVSSQLDPARKIFKSILTSAAETNRAIGSTRCLDKVTGASRLLPVVYHVAQLLASDPRVLHGIDATRLTVRSFHRHRPSTFSRRR